MLRSRFNPVLGPGLRTLRGLLPPEQSAPRAGLVYLTLTTVFFGSFFGLRARPNASRRADAIRLARRNEPHMSPGRLEAGARTGRRAASRPLSGADVRRPRVVVSCDQYLPGVHAGGPIRSIAALVATLDDEVDFRIVTRDRDLGAALPTRVSPGVVDGEPAHAVLYCPSGEPAALRRGRAPLGRPDVVYLNSLFSPRFSLLPFLLRRSDGRGARFVVAPRGELHPGALSLRRGRSHRSCGSRAGRGWSTACSGTRRRKRRQSTSEVASVRERTSSSPPSSRPRRARVVRSVRPRKRPGHLEIAFLSRISEKKNLVGAIDHLRTFRDRSGSTSTVPRRTRPTGSAADGRSLPCRQA